MEVHQTPKWFPKDQLAKRSHQGEWEAAHFINEEGRCVHEPLCRSQLAQAVQGRQDEETVDEAIAAEDIR